MPSDGVSTVAWTSVRGSDASATTPPCDTEKPVTRNVALTGTLAYARGSRSCADVGVPRSSRHSRPAPQKAKTVRRWPGDGVMAGLLAVQRFLRSGLPGLLL